MNDFGEYFIEHRQCHRPSPTLGFGVVGMNASIAPEEKPDVRQPCAPIPTPGMGRTTFATPSGGLRNSGQSSRFAAHQHGRILFFEFCVPSP
jgi:hypothetical protein